MCAGLPILYQNNNRPVCLYMPVHQNCLIPCDSGVVNKHHGLGGLIIFPPCWHGVIPILEEAPVDILCHIVMPVCDLGLEEFLASSNK
eukprot:2943377-Ditylum_brightwellii.AAC.1